MQVQLDCLALIQQKAEKSGIEQLEPVFLLFLLATLQGVDILQQQCRQGNADGGAKRYQAAT